MTQMRKENRVQVTKARTEVDPTYPAIEPGRVQCVAVSNPHRVPRSESAYDLNCEPILLTRNGESMRFDSVDALLRTYNYMELIADIDTGMCELRMLGPKVQLIAGLMEVGH